MLYGQRKPRKDTAIHPLPYSARIRETGRRSAQELTALRVRLRLAIAKREHWAVYSELGEARWAMLTHGQRDDVADAKSWQIGGQASPDRSATRRCRRGRTA
jgi:hypothetical protein